VQAEKCCLLFSIISSRSRDIKILKSANYLSDDVTFNQALFKSVALIGVYTDFINGGRTVKNWYLVMKTRRFRINNFRVTSDLGEFVRFYRVLKIFFIEQGVCFFFLVQF